MEELDERMKKLTHKLENARRDMVRGAASEAYAVDGPVRLRRGDGLRQEVGEDGSQGALRPTT